MTINEEIFAKAMLLVKGELLKDEEAVLKEICAMACDELMGRLKEDVLLTDIHDSFVRSAGTLALAMFLEAETSQVQSFSAGSVHVSRQNPAQIRASADSLRRQAELMLLGYLKDYGFGFKAVRG